MLKTMLQARGHQTTARGPDAARKQISSGQPHVFKIKAELKKCGKKLPAF